MIVLFWSMVVDEFLVASYVITVPPNFDRIYYESS